MIGKRKFGEAERYVITRWAACYELQVTMEGAREKYQQIWDDIASHFLSKYPDYYSARIRPVQISGDQSGVICISKKTWPKDGKIASGIWIENIRLEIVSEEDQPPPRISVWIAKSENMSDDVFKQVKRRIIDAATVKLPPNLLALATKEMPDDGYAVAYDFLPKNKFMELLADANSETFLSFMLEHLEMLVKLCPTVDECFSQEA